MTWWRDEEGFSEEKKGCRVAPYGVDGVFMDLQERIYLKRIIGNNIRSRKLLLEPVKRRWMQGRL